MVKIANVAFLCLGVEEPCTETTVTVGEISGDLTFREPMVSLQQVLRDYLFNFYPLFFFAPLSPSRDRRWFWQVIKWQEKTVRKATAQCEKYNKTQGKRYLNIFE